MLCRFCCSGGGTGITLSNISSCRTTSFSRASRVLWEGGLGAALGVAEAAGVATDEGTGVSDVASEGVVGFGEAVDLTVLAAERERRAFAGFFDGRGV
jgi:hypothetical protein